MGAMAPRSKREYAARAATGEFGNQSLMWNSPSELFASNYIGPVAIRYRGAPGGPCIYDIPQDVVLDYWSHLLKQGYKEDRLFLNDMMPDGSLLFQGEIRRPLEKIQPGYEIYYSTLPRPMREALRAAPQWADGVRATMLLRHYLDPPSFDDLEDILRRFPDAVVELGRYSVKVGVLRRYTIFWEVRNY